VNIICKRAQWSAEAESEAQELSGLEDLLEIVGLEVMVEGVRAGTHSELEGESSRSYEL